MSNETETETGDGESDSDRLDLSQEFHVWNASAELAEEEKSVVHF